jgi:manganese transport protein
VEIAPDAATWRRFLRLAGPGLLVSVGYMDPGNWATDIEGGSRYGFSLLWVVAWSSVAAMLLQTLSLRLGLAAGKDLARACRKHFTPRVNVVLWLAAELAIIACDVAEVLGTALALHLLFGVSLLGGIAITAFDTTILVATQVVLSLQLPFAMWPLIRFTSDESLMGPFASGPVMKLAAWTVFIAISAANLWLLRSLLA